jgi:hypothetical protein
MDALTHTILALACIAGAYYGGRALLLREARSMWTSIATPEMKREIELMNALIKRMSQEDQDYVDSLTPEDYQQPLQLELFAEYHEAPSE